MYEVPRKKIVSWSVGEEPHGFTQSKERASRPDTVVCTMFDVLSQ